MALENLLEEIVETIEVGACLLEIEVVDRLRLEKLLKEVIESVETRDCPDFVFETAREPGKSVPGDEQDVFLLGERLSFDAAFFAAFFATFSPGL